MAEGNVLRFPRAAKVAEPVQPSTPNLQTFEPKQVRELLIISHRVLSSGHALIEFVDSDRALAHQAGIESIGIEISSILSGDQIRRVIDTLEEGMEKDAPVDISNDGLAGLRRLERLLAEAHGNMVRFAGVDARPGASEIEHGLGALRRYRLSQSGVSIPWWILVGFGVLAVGAVVIMVCIKRK